MERNAFEEFIDSPRTIDFIAENSDYFREFIKNKPYIVPGAALNGGYIIAYIDEKNLDIINQDLGFSFTSSESVVLGLLGREALVSSGIAQVHTPNLNLRGKGVVLGIVDTGIDYTQNAFRYEDGTTRIISIYDQTIRGDYPFNYFVGTEYTREQINRALMTNNPLSVVPSTDTVGHGTFLASIAAGSENEELTGAAPEAEIVVVKLKKARNYYINKYLVPPEQENVYESSAVMVGIDYIIRKAQQLGRPAAICIGLGTNIGGHSGLSLFEEYIETVSNYTGVCLCVAAGNESQAMHHYLGKVPANSSEMVQLKVGENAGDIYINMWNSASERLSVSVRSPTGEVVQRVPARSASRLETMLVLERTTVIIEYQFPFRGRGGQNTIIKLLSATPGVWTFTVYGDITIEGIYHMWLPITGFVSPEVSFFMPDPYYTITIPATSNGPITCGGYNSVGNSLYEKSSWGPTRLPALAPDIVAPALNVTGIYPWGPGVMSGTSVAAAISAGAGALMLQWGIVEGNDIAISTFRIRAYFIIGANRNPGIIYPSLQWGFGSLNLSQAINLI